MSWEEQRTKRTTYKLDDAGQQAGQDTLYSNDLHTLQRGIHSNLYLRFDTAALHTTLSAQVNNSHYRQEDRLRRVHTGQDLTTINPHLMIDWKHWYLGLDSETDGPSPDQLQPLLDNTNTLVQRRGKPNLKPKTRWNSELLMITQAVNGMLSYPPIFLPSDANWSATCSLIHWAGNC
ncbi:MAG: hypothetical protein JKY70_00465 [Mucilaginibacter sp.]|nr:hypothetical protein [Mucilaginibacter sp.]